MFGDTLNYGNWRAGRAGEVPRHNHLPSVFLTEGVLLVVDEISGLSPLMLMTKAARLKKGEKLFVRGESGKKRESKEKHLEECTGCYPPPRRGYFERNRTGRGRRKKKEERRKIKEPRHNHKGHLLFTGDGTSVLGERTAEVAVDEAGQLEGEEVSRVVCSDCWFYDLRGKDIN